MKKKLLFIALVVIVIFTLFVFILFGSSFIPYQSNRIKEIKGKPFETEFMQTFLCDWLEKPNEDDFIQYSDGNKFFCKFYTESFVGNEFLQNISNEFVKRHKKNFVLGAYKQGDLFYPNSIYFFNDPKKTDFIKEDSSEISFCVYYTNVIVNSFSFANLEEGFRTRALNLRHFTMSLNKNANDDGQYIVTFYFEMLDTTRKGFYADGDFFTAENKGKWVIKFNV